MPIYYNQKGEVIKFDADGYSQYGYDKAGNYKDWDIEGNDPEQVATTTKPVFIKAGTAKILAFPTSNASRYWTAPLGAAGGAGLMYGISKLTGLGKSGTIILSIIGGIGGGVMGYMR